MRPLVCLPPAFLMVVLASACGSESGGGGVGGSGGNAMPGTDAGGSMDAPGGSAVCNTTTPCQTPPPNACEGDTLRTYHDPNGSCVAGACSYRSTTQVCPNGCQGDRCLSAGTSDGGGPSGDGPPGQGGELCGQVRCSNPPANECDGSKLKQYFDPNGTCNAGVCTYKFSTRDCQRGCKDGSCIACTPGSAVFSADVTDLDSLATVGPLPALAGGAGYEIRSYMQVKDSFAGVRVPIRAPTKMTLVASSNYIDPLHDPSDTAYKGEWGLVFEATCNTQVSFAHIREVVKKVSDVTVPSTAGGSAGELVSAPVDFAAGEIIGYYIRGPGFFAWDFIVTDTSVTNPFINMPRYQDAQLKFLHAICPYDPYPPAMRQKYLDLLGTNNDPPKAGRKCGTVAHDRAGTVAGLWFHAPYSGGTPDQARSASSNPLSIFKAETDVVYVANLDGDINKAGFATFRIEPSNPTYRDPETITDSHCFERRTMPTAAATGWAYVKRVSETQMQVAYSEQGACPAAFPGTGVRNYYR